MKKCHHTSENGSIRAWDRDVQASLPSTHTRSGCNHTGGSKPAGDPALRNGAPVGQHRAPGLPAPFKTEELSEDCDRAPGGSRATIQPWGGERLWLEVADTGENKTFRCTCRALENGPGFLLRPTGLTSRDYSLMK
uniref:Uncharacterized protein n=1 Tax=Rousettus aegyptiacus TaxID=9407 RepID=A0A7J8BAA0_ROUAE|nr:hypothetical protein HJG63_009986 [Rousettus aegyptiacus]